MPGRSLATGSGAATPIVRGSTAARPRSPKFSFGARKDAQKKAAGEAIILPKRRRRPSEGVASGQSRRVWRASIFGNTEFPMHVIAI